MSGLFIGNSVYLLNFYFFKELKAEWLLLECLQEISGGEPLVFMVVFSYMADITDSENRTKRMSFLSGLWPIGTNIGKAISGIIESHYGMEYNFVIGMAASLFSALYVSLFVKDSTNMADTDNTSIRRENSACRLLDVSNIKAGFNSVFAKRANNVRTYVIALVICINLETFINVGEWSSAYLFLRR